MALLSIQINHHAGTPKHNNYKRHNEPTSQFVTLGLRSDGCQRRKSSLQVIDIELEVILDKLFITFSVLVANREQRIK